MRRLSSAFLGMILSSILFLFVTEVFAQDTVCDRTDEVQVAILAEIDHPNPDFGCEDVTSAQLSRIPRMYVAYRDIRSLQSRDFEGLSELDILRLDSNDLTSLPSGLFAGLSNLTFLRLDSNDLEELDQDLFDDLEKLDWLDLQYNNLTVLPEDLFQDTRLDFLDLTRNRLDGTLPSDLFDGLDKLRHLDLSANSIDALPEDLFDGLAGLEVIFFTGNNLTAIPADLFDDVPDGVRVGLGRNNISCLPPKILNRINAGGITLSSGGPYAPCEDPNPEVTLHLSDNPISEDGGMTTVTARLSEMSTEVTTIVISVSPESPTDHSLSTNATLTIAAGETESTGEVVIRAVQNVVYSGDRMFQVEGEATNPDGVNGPESVPLTITEDEMAPALTLAAAPNSVSEDHGATEITVTASWDVVRDRATEVDVAVGSGSAMVGEDFEEVNSFSLTIPANEMMGTGMFTLVPIPDDLNESDETILVTGRTDLGEATPAALTLTNADPPPQVTLALSPSSIMENSDVPSMVTAQLSAPSNAVTTIVVSVAPDSPGDYTQRGTMLTIAAGETESTGEVLITAMDNNVYTGNKTFQVQGEATNLRSGAKDPDDVELTIEDDEPFPTATLAINPNEIREGEEREVTVTGRLDVAFGATEGSGHILARMTVSSEDGTASVVEDLERTSIITLAWEANELVEEQRYAFFVAKQDGIDEPPETIRLVGAGAYDVTDKDFTASPTEFTIVDADDPPVVTLNLTAPEIQENGGTTRLTASQTPASSEPTTIAITMVPDAPATDDDYTLPSTMLTIPAGSRISSDGITITAVDNEDYEGDKTVTVRGRPMNELGFTDLSLIGLGDVGLTILDDDEPPRVELAVAPSEVNENGGSQRVTVSAALNAAQSTDTQLTIMVEAETAQAGTDYTATPSSFPLKIAAGSMEGTGMFTFEPLPDDLHEGPEMIQVTGTAGDLEVDAARLTILDATLMPQVELELMPGEIPEEGGMTTVTATLNRPSGALTTIAIGATPIPPATTMDYAFGGNQTLTIKAGQTESTGRVTITAVDNDVRTPSKEVQVTGMVENPIGVTPPDPEPLTITDGDEATGVTLEVRPTQVDEGAGETPIAVIARLDGTRPEPLTVTISVGPGTAMDDDFDPVDSFALTIPANEREGMGTFSFTPVSDDLDEPDESVTITGTSSLGVDQAFLTITDDDLDPEVMLVLDPAEISEAEERSTVKARLTSPSSAETVITISADPISPATEGDYRLSADRRLTIAAGAMESTETVMITSVNNRVIDVQDKQVRVQGRATNAHSGASLPEAILTILDDDEATEVRLTVSISDDVREDEGSKQITVTATMDGILLTDTEVEISLQEETAILGVDFQPVAPFTIRIPANAMEAVGGFTFTPIPDHLDEPDETVRVSGTSSLGAASEDRLTIFDSDPTPEVTLVLTPGEILEDGGEAEVTANLSGASSAETVITIATDPQAPALTEDYEVSSNRVLRIAPEVTTSTGVVTITAVDNAIDAPDKRITVRGDATNVNDVMSPAEETLIILDDDEVGGITLTVSPSRVNEADEEDIQVTATLDGARSVPTQVMLTVEGGTAEEGTDYAAVPPVALTIGAGATIGTERFPFRPIADGVHEPDETVQVTGRSSLGAAAPATLTIVDRDPVPRVELIVEPGTIPEEGGMATITARLDVASSAETILRVSARPEAPATTDDYELSPNTTLTILPGMMTSTGLVTITAVDNDAHNQDKIVVVRGQATNALDLNGPGDKMLTIEDDEASTGFMLEVAPPKMEEGAGAMEFMVTATLESVRSTDATVTLTVEDGTATEGQDYTIVSPPTPLRVEANQLSGTATFTLMPIDDSVYDPQETILITGTSAMLGGGETVTYLTIEDNEVEVFLAIQDTTVQEEVEMAMVEVTLTSPAPPGLSVRVQTFDQTATELEDYRAPLSRLFIPEGETSAFIAVEILDDESYEENETFRVQLSDPIGAELARGEATVTIEDDDRYELRVEDASAPESESTLEFMVTLNRANPAQSVRVAYATQDGSAQADLDYMPTSGTLVFPRGVDRRPVPVRLLNDETEEMEERFFLKLSMPENAVLVDAEGTGTIVDEDALPRVEITPSVRVGEEEGTARFMVSLSHVLPGRETEVFFTAINETAVVPLDYEVQTPSPLRFTSGERMQTIEVEILDDDLSEGEETFRIELTEILNGEPAGRIGRGTILDNDGEVRVRIQDTKVDESEPEARFRVTLDGQDSQSRTYAYTTEDGTATAGEDYVATSSTITFAAGEQEQEIRIPINDDQETEGNETFQVRLIGEGIARGVAEGTIQDDDGDLFVSIGDASAMEGEGALLLPIHLNQPSPRVVTVQFASSEDTATEGSDYVASKGIVIFERGSMEGKIRIEIIDDSEVEPDETFQVTLSNANHVKIDQGTGTGTILDDDGSLTVSVQSVTVSRHTASFEVGLSIPSAVPVLVSYMSEDGSALAGEDYEAVAGQVTFAPGELSKTVDVKLLTNEPVWEAKTFSLVLLSAVNAEVEQARSEAVMEEESEERIQNAYVSRVLRTWASQVVEALTRRMEGMAHCRIPDLSWLRYGRERWSPGEIFRGCGAEFTQGGWSIWGQGAYTRMQGREGALSMRSDVTSMILGADYAWSQGWMAGLLAAQNWDQGAYETPARSGTAFSRLTGIYPYVSYQTGAGMRAWLLLGLGRGETEVETLESELEAALVALGLTGTLTGGSAGRLGYEVDAFWATADLETGADLGIRRVRAGVEGSLRLGAGMQPYMEAALRQDGGDAETGMGVELGGGVRWSTSQLRAEFGGRTLVLHTDDGLREWGLMGSVEYGSQGGLGPSMRVRPHWGNVYGGDLWREAPLHTIAGGSADQNVEVELGYGTPIGASLGRSIVGLTLDPSGRAYRVGYNLHMGEGLQVSVATTARTIEENGPPPSYGLSARMDLKW